MTPIFAKARVQVWGTSDSWSLAPHAGSEQQGKLCDVELEIQGNDKDGYHLVMTPAGFFAADSWHESQEAAQASAAELFGTKPSDWSVR